MIHTNPTKAHGFPGDDCLNSAEGGKTTYAGSERELAKALDLFAIAVADMTKRELAQAPGKEPTPDFIQSCLHAELCRHDVEKAVQAQLQAAKAEAADYARANEHHVISNLLTNEDLAALSPATVRRLKARKATLTPTPTTKPPQGDKESV